jgi:multimeric flavodoxin WrbA
MKALVLTALHVDAEHGERAQAALLDALSRWGYDVETVDCPSAEVIPCTGCGSCGMRTPGVCVVKDDMQGIFRTLVASDLLVLATPVRFGSYCAQLKKVVDRFQPLMMPLYMVRSDEMHFRGRYALPSLMGVGLVRDGQNAAAETEAFRFLIGRLAMNVDTRHSAAAVAGGDEAAARTELERALSVFAAADCATGAPS